MSKAAYIGVGGKARKIKAIYVGDESGRARRVTAGYVGVGGVARQFFASGGILGELDVGETVKLNVSGVPKEFLVVHQGISSGNADGTWLLMKEKFSNCVWTPNSTFTGYDRSNLALKQVPAFLNALDEGVRSIILSTNPGKAFSLSAGQVGHESISDGEKLDYFLAGNLDEEARERRVEAGNNSWWLRTTADDDSMVAYVVGTSGWISTDSMWHSNGFRPALILPRDTRVTEDGTVIP